MVRYAYGQLNLDLQTARQCNFSLVGGAATGTYRFRTGFFSRHPGAPAPPVSEYDQNYSVSVLTKLKPFVDNLNSLVCSSRTPNECACIKEQGGLNRPLQKATKIDQSHACNTKAQRCNQCVVSVRSSLSHACTPVFTSNSMDELNLNDSVSSISSIPPDYTSDPPSVPTTPTGFETGHTSLPDPPAATSGPVVNSQPSSPAAVDPALMNTLLAAVRSESRQFTHVATDTEHDLAVDQFSTDLIVSLSASDALIKKVKKALAGSDEDRQAMGTYWATLWRDLHVAPNGCVFLDNRILLPEALRAAFLQFLHSTHGGPEQ